MKTHIFLTLIALMVSACASKENVSQAKLQEQQRQQQEFTQNEMEAATRFR